jgi:hypothetical protein
VEVRSRFLTVLADQDSLMVSDKKMYGKRFLNTDCSSDGFLNAISYSVELSGKKK